MDEAGIVNRLPSSLGAQFPTSGSSGIGGEVIIEKYQLVNLQGLSNTTLV